MRIAGTLEELSSAPTNRYLVRRTFCVWQTDDCFRGVIAWGSPGVEDVAELIQVLEALAVGPSTGRLVVVDTRRVERVDPHAFEMMLAYLEASRERSGERIERLAMVVHRSVFGASLAGLVWMVRPLHECVTFYELERALAWVAGNERAGDVQQVSGLYNQLFDAMPIVSRTRALLEAALKPPSIAEVAASLNLSPRTLQRRLEEAGTSYREEVSTHRLKHGERLLEQSSERIQDIARRLGLESEAQFTRLFRSAHGMSPRDWRARVRQQAQNAHGGPPSSVAPQSVVPQSGERPIGGHVPALANMKTA